MGQKRSKNGQKCRKLEENLRKINFLLAKSFNNTKFRQLTISRIATKEIKGVIMKIKALLATLVGAVALQGATAGTWCPPAPAKCPIDDCPDVGANVSVGYGTDYFFYGVRFARDHFWGDVNYTFDKLPVPITLGVWHLTDIGANSFYGDETNLYLSAGLPSIMGFDASIGYTHYLYPTTRGPSPGGPFGDSQSEIHLKISREVACGFSVFYRGAYDFVAPSHLSNPWLFGPFSNRDSGAWVHTLGVDKGIEINDRISLALSGGVYYTDNYWGDLVSTNRFFGTHSGRSSGWNSYYLKAALPIALNCRATLTPYIGYNGTPDTWVADGLRGFTIGGNPNANDAFHGGISLSVDF